MLSIRLLLLTIILNAVLSCNKKELSPNRIAAPVTNTSLLHKVVTTNYDGTVNTTEYTYNSQEKLVKVAFGSSLYTWKNIVDIEYDKDLKLKKATYRTINDSNLVIANIVSYSYVYKNHTIIKRIATPLQPGHQEFDLIYSYDAQGKLIGDSAFNKQTAKVEQCFKYIWKDQNVTRSEYYLRNSNRTFDLVSYTEYSYDDKVNPYLSLPVFFVNNRDGSYLSKNNLTVSTDKGNSPENHENEYNNSGLLTKTSNWASAYPSFFNNVEYYYS